MVEKSAFSQRDGNSEIEKFLIVVDSSGQKIPGKDQLS